MYTNLIGEETMKSVKLAVFMLVAMVFSVSASATGVEASTLTIERFCTSNVGQAMSSNSYSLRLKDAPACTTAQTAMNNKNSTLYIADRPIPCITIARCDAVDYHLQY